MKKKKLNLQGKVLLRKEVISSLQGMQLITGGASTIPPFDQSIGCPGQSDNCSLDVCSYDGCPSAQCSKGCTVQDSRFPCIED